MARNRNRQKPERATPVSAEDPSPKNEDDMSEKQEDSSKEPEIVEEEDETVEEEEDEEEEDDDKSDQSNDSEDTITMVLPRNVTITDDDHTTHRYAAGVQEVHPRHVDHWYMKASGATRHVKKKTKGE